MLSDGRGRERPIVCALPGRGAQTGRSLKNSGRWAMSMSWRSTVQRMRLGDSRLLLMALSSCCWRWQTGHCTASSPLSPRQAEFLMDRLAQCMSRTFSGHSPGWHLTSPPLMTPDRVPTTSPPPPPPFGTQTHHTQASTRASKHPPVCQTVKLYCMTLMLKNLMSPASCCLVVAVIKAWQSLHTYSSGAQYELTPHAVS